MGYISRGITESDLARCTFAGSGTCNEGPDRQGPRERVVTIRVLVGDTNQPVVRVPEPLWNSIKHLASMNGAELRSARPQRTECRRWAEALGGGEFVFRSEAARRVVDEVVRAFSKGAVAIAAAYPAYE